ncbi:MAG TPA: thymidine phosphorylase [Vicinamibacterales bacterium]|nr:thymidine phosphorylase [Vicinamibacterales bacterium]
MRFADVIARKRDGQALTRPEIDLFVRGVVDGSVPDYQAAALLMAIVLKGMDDGETAALTEAMVASGERVDLSAIPGPKVGKHSTGGVGDKVSIIVVPLVAACGVAVPKMSGRALGHTGGTVDQLESIPGFRADATIAEFKQLIRDVGAAIVGQSPSLAPADKKIYSLRDVTATVESVPLISASIMSKKLAEGSTSLVLDVKCGKGAFMKTDADARALARSLVAIGSRAGLRTEALITRMDAPIGSAVGNAVEIIECIEVLKGRGPDDLVDLATTVAGRMLTMSGKYDAGSAAQSVRHAIDSGEALAKLRAIIARQSGDPKVVDDYQRLPGAAYREAVVAPRSGYVTGLNAEFVGRAAIALGAGRERAGQRIDHGAGVLIAARVGDKVSAGDPVLTLLSNNAGSFGAARALAEEAIAIGDAAPPARPLLIDICTAN